MIAKSKWFSRRKYAGWGLFPKTWQGILYTIVIVAIIFLINMLPLDITYRMVLFIIIGVFLIVDIKGAMLSIKDEREKIHEAIAERNAMWAVVLVSTLGIGFQVASSTIKKDYSSIDWFLVAALGSALIVKAFSNIWLDRND